MEHLGILEICVSGLWCVCFFFFFPPQIKWYLMKHVSLGKINISPCQLIGSISLDRVLAGN